MITGKNCYPCSQKIQNQLHKIFFAVFPTIRGQQTSLEDSADIIFCCWMPFYMLTTPRNTHTGLNSKDATLEIVGSCKLPWVDCCRLAVVRRYYNEKGHKTFLMLYLDNVCRVLSLFLYIRLLTEKYETPTFRLVG